jgi:Electron transfer DM13
MRILLLSLSYLAVFTMGFGLGVYLLPILAAPPAPAVSELRAAMQSRMYGASFRRDLAGSDLLHWGEGQVTVGRDSITLTGRLAPGPAYKLYLVPEFVETGEQFLQTKSRSLVVGDVKTFENFIVTLPPGTPVENYTTVVVWCEAFSRFITAAKYR